MSTWAKLAVLILTTSLIRGDYGDKVRVNETASSLSSENFGSSEEYYDDSSEEKPTSTPEKLLTTPDDGVVIEKAILAAEITPKASYNLVDYPIRYDESLGDSYTQARFGDKNEFFGYSSSDALSSQEEVNTLVSSENNKSNGKSIYKAPEDKSNTDSMQKSPQTHNGYQFPSWNFLSMYNIPSVMPLKPLKPFSATYINPINVDIQPTEGSDIKNNGLGLSEDGSYDPVANGDFLHLGYQSSPHQSEPSFSATFSPDLAAHFEQEKQYQIQSTKSYLRQVEAAQEYAAKVQALQEALYPIYQDSQINFSSWPSGRMHETIDSFPSTATTQTPKPKIVPKPEAPGINSFGHQIMHSRPGLFSPVPQVTAAQVNSLSGGSWMVPVVAPSSPSSGFIPYTGPTASPVVLPSGFLADTEEVMQAKIMHLQALMNAMKASSAWKSRQSQRWS